MEMRFSQYTKGIYKKRVASNCYLNPSPFLSFLFALNSLYNLLFSPLPITMILSIKLNTSLFSNSCVSMLSSVPIKY